MVLTNHTYLFSSLLETLDKTFQKHGKNGNRATFPDHPLPALNPTNAGVPPSPSVVSPPAYKQ